jgi:hypothetical protein
MMDIALTIIGLLTGAAIGREFYTLRRDVKALQADVATRAKSRGKRGAR